jgi:hypothetical protein
MADAVADAVAEDETRCTKRLGATETVDAGKSEIYFITIV